MTDDTPARQKTLFPFNYDDLPPELAAEFRAEADAIRSCAATAAPALIEMGQRLLRVKNKMKAESMWCSWLDTEFGWSASQAHRAVTMAEIAKNLEFVQWTKIEPATVNALARAPKAVRQRVVEFLQVKKADIGEVEVGEVIRAEIAREVARKKAKADEIAAVKDSCQYTTLVAAWQRANQDTRSRFMAKHGLRPVPLTVVPNVRDESDSDWPPVTLAHLTKH